jgi:hypothetical protein
VNVCAAQSAAAPAIPELQGIEVYESPIKELCDALRDTWSDKLTEYVPSDRILIPWINRYGAEEIEAAIVCAIPAYTHHKFGYDENRAFNKLIPWVGGILRNRSGRELGVVQ